MGFTQQFLANKASVAQSQVAEWEKGKRIPEIDNAAKLAKALEVTIDYLYGLVDKPQDTLKEQGLSEREYKVVHRYRADAVARQLIDRSIGIDQPKQLPTLPAPKEHNEGNETAATGKEPAED